MKQECQSFDHQMSQRMLSCEQMGYPFYSLVTIQCIFISCVSEFVISVT
jgi:hypothetical protein